MYLKQEPKGPKHHYTEMQNSLKSLRVIMIKRLGTAVEEERSHKKLLESVRKRIQELEKKKEDSKRRFESLAKEK